MKKSKTLKAALWANVIFSVLTALIAIFFTDRWIAVNDLTQGKGLAFGIILLLFSVYVAIAALRRKINSAMIWSIIILDLLYVIGVVSRLFNDPSFSLSGLIMTASTGVAVILLAVFQFKGFLKSKISHAEK